MVLLAQVVHHPPAIQLAARDSSCEIKQNRTKFSADLAPGPPLAQPYTMINTLSRIRLEIECEIQMAKNGHEKAEPGETLETLRKTSAKLRET